MSDSIIAKSRADDGRKFLCDVGVLRSPCVIYSFGSNGDYSFEASMLNNTVCDVFTFDCTYDGASIHPRHTYLRWCLDKKTRNVTNWFDFIKGECINWLVPACLLDKAWWNELSQRMRASLRLSNLSHAWISFSPW